MSLVLFIVNNDCFGVIVVVVLIFVKYEINISIMSVFCKEKGRRVFMVIEIDELLVDEVIEEIKV